MANRTISIGLPVLLANQGFRIEYRLQGDIAWTLYGIITTNEVTIPGLTEGECYEYRITFLQSLSPLIECSPVVRPDCIPSGEGCIGIDAAIEESEGRLQLVVQFEPESPYILPCGGYKLEYGLLSSPQQPLTVIYYTTIDYANSLVVPNIVPGTYYVAISVIDCEGNETLCEEQVVSSPEEECTPASLISAVLTYSGGIYKVTLTFNPSVPPSPVYYIQYNQANLLFSGINDPGGLLFCNSTGSSPEVFIFEVTPNINTRENHIRYVGAIVDGCNFSTKWQADLYIE